MMKPFAIVQALCAYYDDVALDQPDGKCLVERGLPCIHFEKAVLPVLDQGQFYAKWLGARKAYWKDIAQGAPTQATSARDRQCACGAPLAARRRVCDDCQRKRRKLTYRQANRGRKS